jgi:hypothetical protein
LGFESLEFRVHEDLPWLLVEPQEGIVGSAAEKQLVVIAAPAGLPAGNYEGSLQFQSNDLHNPVQFLSVKLAVGPRRESVDSDRIGIQEAGFACANGDDAVQFVELTAFGAGESYRSSLGLRIEDREGRIVLERQDLFGSAREGQTWETGRTWLLASDDFAGVAGVFPDDLLPSQLDPIGGTITLYDQGSSGTVLHRFSYGSVDGVNSPAPGHSLAREARGIMREGQPTPTNSNGQQSTQFDCPCPVNTIRAYNVVISTSESAAAIPGGPSLLATAGYNLTAGTLLVPEASVRTYVELQPRRP